MTIKFRYRDYFRSKARNASTETEKGDLVLIFTAVLNFTTIPLYSIAFAHEKAAVREHLQM